MQRKGTVTLPNQIQIKFALAFLYYPIAVKLTRPSANAVPVSLPEGFRQMLPSKTPAPPTTEVAGSAQTTVLGSSLLQHRTYSSTGLVCFADSANSATAGCNPSSLARPLLDLALQACLTDSASLSMETRSSAHSGSHASRLSPLSYGQVHSQV